MASDDLKKFCGVRHRRRKWTDLIKELANATRPQRLTLP